MSEKYLNNVIRGDKADYKDFPDIRFSQNTTSDITLAGHPGYLLNGAFRNPTSHALQEFSNIGTVIGDEVYSVIYYSPAETYPVYITKYNQMVESFEIMQPQSQRGNHPQPSPMHAPTPTPTPTIRPTHTTTSQIDGDWPFYVIVVAAIIYAAWKLTHRKRKRRGFSQSVMLRTLEKQHNKCADCKRLLNVVEYHHKNGNRWDNRESNCQALCPNCHAYKTRR